jgi:hypothetical protein
LSDELRRIIFLFSVQLFGSGGV